MSLLQAVNPGRLRHRVAIMRYHDTTDALGNTVNVLQEYKKVWAEIKPLRGTEQLEYYKYNNQETYKVTIRYTDVTAKDVLRFSGRQFQIQAVINPNEDRYYLELMCIEDIDHAVKEEVGE